MNDVWVVLMTLLTMYLFLVLPLVLTSLNLTLWIWSLIFVHVRMNQETKTKSLISFGKLKNELCFTFGRLFIVNTGWLIMNNTFLLTDVEHFKSILLLADSLPPLLIRIQFSVTCLFHQYNLKKCHTKLRGNNITMHCSAANLKVNCDNQMELETKNRPYMNLILRKMDVILLQQATYKFWTEF